jgi:hypothetical protein
MQRWIRELLDAKPSATLRPQRVYSKQDGVACHYHTYKSWTSMLYRANNRDGYHPAYAHVSVCDRWYVLENFVADMGLRPEGTTLSRFGDVGDYCKENCAWHTRKQQRSEATKHKTGSYRVYKTPPVAAHKPHVKVSHAERRELRQTKSAAVVASLSFMNPPAARGAA